MTTGVMTVLGSVTVAFMALFWLTPAGVPRLTRMGGGRLSPDLTFRYDADSTYALIDRYGTPGVKHWRRLLLLDMIFPGVYAAFLALAGDAWSWAADAGEIWRLAAIGSPILSGASDYVENILLLAVLAALPRKMPRVVAGASVFTRAKFVFFLATLAAPLLYWAASITGSWR
jgi:hypothetical protein